MAIMHIRWGSLISYTVGTSPLESLVRTIRIDDAALQMVKTAMGSIGLTGN